MAFLFVVCYYALCIAFFVFVQRPLFCLYNLKSSMAPIHLRDVWHIFYKGVRSDLIAAAYLTALPMVIVWLNAHFPRFDCCVPLLCCNLVLSVAVGLLTVADTALYRFWQSKIDASVFTYLRSLKGAFASVSAAYIAVALILVCVVSGVFFTMLELLSVYYSEMHIMPESWVNHCLIFVGFLSLVIFFFIIIRGLKRRPNNPSIVFYSSNPFCNHSALNPLYSLIYSLSLKENFSKQFRYFPPEECRKIVAPAFVVEGTPQVQLLNTKRPNILLIVWESLCAKYVGSLGGMQGVAENFDRLACEGVLFTRCTAGSFRTDRGLVCILSGYLGQPTTSIINYSRKLPHLPALPRTLRDIAGYATMAVHGGDLSIFHKSDYYLASGHDRIVCQSDFPSNAPKCSWGVHDGYIFKWLYDDILQKERKGVRWYTTFQTLSSHEPFTVPYDRIKDDMVANSFAYVDACFGEFVEKLRFTSAWDNLLIICTGDHGINLQQALSRDEQSHIPLLLLGGAIKQPCRIDTLMSQTDIAATLLGQMELPHADFTFSRDVLADTYTCPFSFHTYNNGFLLRDERGYINFDNVANIALEGADSRREKMGKAILQTLYDDLDRR